jgi:hypothetical protein
MNTGATALLLLALAGVSHAAPGPRTRTRSTLRAGGSTTEALTSCDHALAGLCAFLRAKSCKA